MELNNLCVNNLEIIGLDEVKDGDFESNEERILAAINSLEHLNYEEPKNDIDISHPSPTRRKDGKTVSVGLSAVKQNVTY